MGQGGTRGKTPPFLSAPIHQVADKVASRKLPSRKLKTRDLDFPLGGSFTLLTLIECKDNQVLKIGELAQIAGLHAGTIRNYEQQSLLKPAARSETGQHRLYGAEEVARLQFIRQANLAGLTLREVKELLTLIDGGQRGENVPRVREALEKNIRETEQKMELLSGFRDSLLSYRSLAV